jgi:hypothetical protein
MMIDANATFRSPARYALMSAAWLAVREKMRPETKTLFISVRRGVLSHKTVWLAIRRYGMCG